MYIIAFLCAAIAIWLSGNLCLLTANRNVDRQLNPSTVVLPVAAGVHIYRRAFVGLDPAGYAKPFEPGDQFLGLAEGESDNSTGTAGAETVTVEIGPCMLYELTLTGVSLADVGKPVFATDDEAIALSGHPDAYVGTIVDKAGTNLAIVALKGPGEKAPNGVGSVELVLTGHEAFAATGTTAATSSVNGWDLKSILGSGWVMNDGGGVKGDFDAVAEVALCSARTRTANFAVAQGVTFEVDLVVPDKGDSTALDVDWGIGSALTTNSEANIDHADMEQLACFHLDGSSDNVYVQSDDNTTDVSVVDTQIDNDSTDDTMKRYKVIVRPSGAVEFWIDGVRRAASTMFAVSPQALVGAFVNMEKGNDDTTASIIFRNLRVAGAAA